MSASHDMRTGATNCSYTSMFLPESLLCFLLSYSRYFSVYCLFLLSYLMFSDVKWFSALHTCIILDTGDGTNAGLRGALALRALARLCSPWRWRFLEEDFEEREDEEFGMEEFELSMVLAGFSFLVLLLICAILQVIELEYIHKLSLVLLFLLDCRQFLLPISEKEAPLMLIRDPYLARTLPVFGYLPTISLAGSPSQHLLLRSFLLSSTSKFWNGRLSIFGGGVEELPPVFANARLLKPQWSSSCVSGFDSERLIFFFLWEVQLWVSLLSFLGTLPKE